VYTKAFFRFFTMFDCRRHWPALLLSAIAGAVLIVAALAPVHYPSREQRFEIARGTAERHAHGEHSDRLPAKVRLTLGARDVLVLKNSDSAPQVFGPFELRPGQEFRLPFEQTGVFQIASTAPDSGAVTIEVLDLPDPGWDRLRWRVDGMLFALRYF
jgi:hypothetical protein